MKRGYFWTYVKIIFIICIIIATILGVVYFLKNGYEIEQLKTVKTDMLLIEGKTKILSEKVKMKEEGASYIGKKIEEVSEETDIKELEEKGIIDVDSKECNYYVLDKSNLDELGLNAIELKEGYYIVEYNSNEIIYSKGVKDAKGNQFYKLSEFIK